MFTYTHVTAAALLLSAAAPTLARADGGSLIPEAPSAIYLRMGAGITVFHDPEITQHTGYPTYLEYDWAQPDLSRVSNDIRNCPPVLPHQTMLPSRSALDSQACIG